MSRKVIVYNTPTKEIFLSICPKFFTDMWDEYQADTCVRKLDGNEYLYSDKTWYLKRGYTITYPFSYYKHLLNQ